MNQQRQKLSNTGSFTATIVNEHNGIQQVIPSGTVASRVRFLQGLSSPSASTTSSTRRRENSRIGFGRRVTNRFANPAVQNATPDQQPQAQSGHSFLGLNTPRSNHREEHAISQYRNTYARSPGINGQIRPQGHMERSQCDAVSPWNVTSREPSRNRMRQANSPDMDVHQEYDYIGNQTDFAAPSSIFPSTANSDYQDMYRRETSSHTLDTVISGTSFTTASSVRRKSVRDLFDDYGIERPAGLASSRETSRQSDETPRPTRPHRYCHLCSWVNSDSSKKCWRCSHRLCHECDDMSPLPVRKEISVNRREGFSPRDLGTLVPELPPKENRCVIGEPVKRESRRPEPSPLQKRSEAPSQECKASATKFLNFQNAGPTSGKTTQITSPRKIPVQEIPKVINVLSGSKVTTSVKESPFLIADLLSSGRSLRLFPIGIEVEARHSQQSHSNYGQKTKDHGKESLSSNIEECESPGCRATHPGYRPYRHSISCSVKAQSKHNLEATDAGYVADTSYTSESSEVNDNNQIATSKPHSESSFRVSSLSSRNSHNSSHQSRSSRNSRLSSPVSEYVECRGYLRTGHVRHGSQFSAGITGECQHCHDDCQCAACQSTHHHVRCCVHPDHNAIVHHHYHTSRKPHSNAKPFECPSKNQHSSVPAKSPSISRSETVIPLTSNIYQEPPTPKHFLFTRPSLQKVCSLPRFKASTFMTGAKKPPTPPPWIDSPRMENTLPATDYQISTCEGAENDTATSINPVENSASVSKNPTPLAQGYSKNLELTSKLDDEAWFSVYSGLKSGSTHEKRCSKTIPSRKSSVIVEKVSRSPSVVPGSPSRQQDSLSRSRSSSRKLSALLQFRERNAIPVLNQKLLDHQEELKKIDKTSDVVAEGTSHGLSGRSDIEPCPTKDIKAAEETDRAPSATSNSSIERRWRLKLIDKKPSSPCPNDSPKSLRERRLSEDDRSPIPLAESPKSHCLGEEEASSPCTDNHNPTSEHRLSQDKPIPSPQPHINVTWLKLPPIKLDDHECFWKNTVMASPESHDGRRDSRLRELGIRGVTIVLHLEGRDDLVIKADFWKGGALVE